MLVFLFWERAVVFCLIFLLVVVFRLAIESLLYLVIWLFSFASLVAFSALLLCSRCLFRTPGPLL